MQRLHFTGGVGSVRKQDQYAFGLGVFAQAFDRQADGVADCRLPAGQTDLGLFQQGRGSFDIETTATLLEESEIGLAGRETAIGDAIGLAVKRLREDAQAERVLILLTDGANTSGEVQPLQAAEFAARQGLTVYTVGVGADEMMVQDFFGSRVVNPSADLDEDTLRAIAERTGGEYFRARDAEGLAEIYRLLDELEPVESDVEIVRPVDELFYWPLGLAYLLACLVVLATLMPSRWARRAAA